MPDVVANGVRHYVQRLGARHGSAPSAPARASDPRASARVRRAPPRNDRGEDPRSGAATRTVVFFHGLVMDNLSSWYFTVANRVATSCDVVLYDLRGHGRSERPAAGYTVRDLTTDLACLLDALDIRHPVGLVGNSFGGLLAVAFAAAYPHRVNRMALVDAHYSAEGWTEAMASTLELQGEARDRMILDNFKNWLGRGSERKRSKLARTAEALVYGTSLVDDIRRSRSIGDDELAAIACPTLALYGEQSDALARGKHLAAALPACTLRIFPGCTHSVLWERTGEVRDQLAAWFADLPSPAGGRVGEGGGVA